MRAVTVRILVLSLGLSTVLGCKPAFQGTIATRDGPNNGLGPTPPAGQAQITSASPSSAKAGSPGFAMTVTGLNFLPSTTVMWDNSTPLVTTYVSPTTLRAQVPASLIARTEMGVALDPSPIGSFNFGANFTVAPQSFASSNSFAVSKAVVAANDMVWDPVSRQLYLSVKGSNPASPNSIIALDPTNATLGRSVPATTEPNKLSVSSDGTYIYAGLDATASVHRYTLPALQSDLDIPLGSDASGHFYALDLKAEPGSSHSVAVSSGKTTSYLTLVHPAVGGVVIYDDATARPQAVPGFSGGTTADVDLLAWDSSGQNLYGMDNEGGYDLYLMPVTASGVQLQSQLAGATHFGNHFGFDSTTGFLYTDSGQVVDPATRSIVGTFPFQVLQEYLDNPIMVVDGNLNIAYFAGQTTDSTGAPICAVEAFDLTHFIFLGAISIPDPSGTPIKIVRWGSNGLAILTSQTPGAPAGGDGVYVISGSFVTSPAS